MYSKRAVLRIEFHKAEVSSDLAGEFTFYVFTIGVAQERGRGIGGNDLRGWRR
jgi:hypothetical protein